VDLPIADIAQETVVDVETREFYTIHDFGDAGLAAHH